MLRLNRTASENFNLMLSQLLQTEPSAVSQIMREFGYNVPVSTEAVLTIARIEGQPFTDELFLIWNGAHAQTSRFAAFTGQAVTEGYTMQQKTFWDQGLEIATGAMEVLNGIKNPVKTEDESFYDYQVNPKSEKKKYLGLSAPVFWGGITVLVLLLIFVAVKNSK